MVVNVLDFSGSAVLWLFSLLTPLRVPTPICMLSYKYCKAQHRGRSKKITGAAQQSLSNIQQPCQHTIFIKQQAQCSIYNH